MASGIINLNNSSQTPGGGYLMGKVEWSGTGSTASNQSSVTANFYVKKASSTGTINVPTTGHWDCSLNVGGSVVSGSVSASIGADWVLMLRDTVPITHNSDGSKSITISASAWGPSGTSYSGLQTAGSGTAVLDNIPRASALTISGGTMGSPVTFDIASASPEFTHSLTYEFGGAFGTILSYASSGSHAWTPPVDLSSQIPNAASGTIVYKLYTWIGNGESHVGTTTYTATLSVPDSVKPSITGVAISEAVSGLAAKFSAYVQNKSRLAVSITAAGAYGATIQSYTTTIQSRSYAGASFTSDILTASGTIKLTVKVADSRGRTASTTASVNVTAYSPPQITTLNAWRIDTSENQTDDGERLALQIAYAIASVGGKNDRTLTVKYRQGSSGTFETISSGAAETSYSGTVNYTDAPELSTDHTYTIQVTLSDYFTSVSYTIEIPTAKYILDILDTKDGAACGKAAEERDLLDVAWAARVRKALRLDVPLAMESGGTGAATQDGAGKKLLDLGYINGDLDDMTSIGACWCDFSYCTNAPFSSGYGYVIRDCASGSVTQTAFRHDIGMIYRRSHVNGAWTKWRNGFDVGAVTATTYPPEAGIYVVTGAKIFQNMTPYSLQGVLVIFHAGYAAHLYIDSYFNLYYGFSGNTFAEPAKWYTPSTTQQS